MVDNKLGRRLVASLEVCRSVYQDFDSPKADKFATGKHNYQYKRMSDALKNTFQTQGLQPYPFHDRPNGTCFTLHFFVDAVNKLLRDIVLTLF